MIPPLKSALRLLPFLVVLSSCSKAEVGTIGVAEFEPKLANPKAQLLDVRTAGEYAKGRLNHSLQADWLDQKQFSERVAHLDKSAPILVYCASGGRSAEAMEWLKAKGFQDVSNLKGGIAAWKMAGKPVVAAAAAAELTVAEFTAAIQAGTVLVDVGAAWCPPCRKMEPVLDTLQQELNGTFKLVKVDGGKDVAVMKHLRSAVLPTFVVFKDGKETWRQQGLVSLAELKAALAP
jgi:rhodanese-related sulfurtransferase